MCSEGASGQPKWTGFDAIRCHLAHRVVVVGHEANFRGRPAKVLGVMMPAYLDTHSDTSIHRGQRVTGDGPRNAHPESSA
jgi:hypothetical protein